MKRRKGFVSNSSTASFVLLGFESNLDVEDLPWDEEYLCGGDEGGCPPGVETVIGKFIFKCSSDSYAEAAVLNYAEILAEVEKAREKYGSTKPIKLWTGVMSC